MSTRSFKSIDLHSFIIVLNNVPKFNSFICKKKTHVELELALWLYAYSNQCSDLYFDQWYLIN